MTALPAPITRSCTPAQIGEEVKNTLLEGAFLRPIAFLRGGGGRPLRVCVAGAEVTRFILGSGAGGVGVCAGALWPGEGSVFIIPSETVRARRQMADSSDIPHPATTRAQKQDLRRIDHVWHYQAQKDHSQDQYY